MVLRDLLLDTRELIFYADARSPKVAQLRRDPRAVLLCWSASLGWQLRLRCHIEVETSGLDVTARWAHIRNRPAAHDYLSPLPPGSTLERPRPERGTREYFAVITATVEAVDWLELHAEGHRRAVFDGGGRRWVAP